MSLSIWDTEKRDRQHNMAMLLFSSLGGLHLNRLNGGMAWDYRAFNGRQKKDLQKKMMDYRHRNRRFCPWRKAFSGSQNRSFMRFPPLLSSRWGIWARKKMRLTGKGKLIRVFFSCRSLDAAVGLNKEAEAVGGRDKNSFGGPRLTLGTLSPDPTFPLSLSKSLSGNSKQGLPQVTTSQSRCSTAKAHCIC